MTPRTPIGADVVGSDGRRVAPVARAACVVLLFVTCVVPQPVRAQEAATGSAYRGLFSPVDPGASSPRPSPLPGIVFKVDVSTLLEANRPSDTSAIDADASHASNSHTAIDVLVSRRISGKRVSYDVRAGSQLRRFHDSRGLQADAQSVSVNVESRLTRRTTLKATGSGTYSPTYTLTIPFTSGSTGEDVRPLGLEVDDALRSVRFTGGAQLSRRMDARTVVDAGYALNRSVFIDRDGATTNQRWSARATREAGNGKSWRVRYDYGRVDTHGPGQALRTLTHEAQVAFLYTPPRSPDTTVSASLTPTFLRRAETGGTPGQPASDASPEQGLRLGALLGVDHRLSAAWRLGVGYQRALYSDDTLVQPSFVQTVMGRLEGRLSRRATASLAAAYSTGVPNAMSPSRPMPDSVGVSARWSIVTSANTAVFAEFQRTAYVQQGALEPGGVPGARLNSHSLRLGMRMNLQGR